MDHSNPKGSNRPTLNPAGLGERLRPQGVRLSLLGVMAVAVLLRSIGVEYPHRFYPDEVLHVPTALRMVESGNFRPDTFIYGSGYPYALAAVYFAAGLLATLSGMASSPADWAGGLRDGDLILPVQLGRWLNVVAGTLSVLAIYAAGKMLYSHRVALVASATIAVVPLAVDDAHFAKEEILGGLWLSIVLVGSAGVLRTGAWKWYLVAAAAAGLAQATRFHGAFALLALAAAHFVRAWPAASDLRPAVARLATQALAGRLLVSLAVAPLVFVAAHPYALLDSPALLEGLLEVGRLVYGRKYGHDLEPTGFLFTPYLYQLGAALPFGLGLGAQLLSLAGFVGFVRRPQRADWVVVGFGVAYLLVSGSFNVVVQRYYIPLTMPAALLAARVLSVSGSLRPLPAAVASAALCYTAAFGFSTAARFLDETRLQAAAWAEQRLAPGSRVALARVHEYTPALSPGGHHAERYDLGVNADWFENEAEAPDYIFLTGLLYQRAYRDPLLYQNYHADYERLRRGQTPYGLVAQFEAGFLNKSFYVLLDPMFDSYYVSPTLEVYQRCADPPCRPLWARQAESAPPWLQHPDTAVGRLSSGPGPFEQPRLLDYGPGFATAWGSMAVPGPRDKQVYFARATDTGRRIGDQLRVTDLATGAGHPDLAWTGAEFALVWEDRRAHPELEELYLRRISPDGQLVGQEVRLTWGTQQGQHSTNPALVWTGSAYGLAFDRHLGQGNFEVFFLALAPDGQPTAEPLRLSHASGPSRKPSLAWTGQGFGLAWEEGPSERSRLLFMLLGAHGNPSGPALQLPAKEGAAAAAPALVWSGEHFGIAWREGEAGGGAYRLAVLDQRGLPLAGSAGHEGGPAGSGSPVLAWTGSRYAIGWSPAAGKLLLQLFDIFGQIQGEPILLNPSPQSRGQGPALHARDGRLGLAWSDSAWGGLDIVLSVLREDGGRVRPDPEPAA